MNLDAYRSVYSSDILIRLEFQSVSKKEIENAIKQDEENILSAKRLLNSSAVSDIQEIISKYIEVKDEKEWKKVIDEHTNIVISDEIRDVYDKNKWYLNEETSQFICDLYYDSEKNLKNVRSIEDLDKISALRLKQIVKAISKYNVELSFQKIFLELVKSRNSALRLYDRMISIQSNQYCDFYKQYMEFKINNPVLDKEMRWMLYANKRLNELKGYCERHPEVLIESEKSIFKRK